MNAASRLLLLFLPFGLLAGCSRHPGMQESQSHVRITPPVRIESAPAGNRPSRAAASADLAAGGPAQAPAKSGAVSRAPDPEPSRSLWRSAAAREAVPPSLAPAPREWRWLLAVGVSSYARPDVSGGTAAADAAMAAGGLAAAAGIAEDHATLLRDSQATRESIRRAVLQLQRRVETGKDLVILYIAGAATIHPGAGRRYVFLPHDADPADPVRTGIPGSDLAAWIGALRAQTVILFLDTPHADAVDLPTAPDPGRRLGLFAATAADSPTGSLAVGSTGVFAGVLVGALRGFGDSNRDGLVSYDELRISIPAGVGPRTGGGQRPQTRTGFGGGTPEVLFLVPGSQVRGVRWAAPKPRDGRRAPGA